MASKRAEKCAKAIIVDHPFLGDDDRQYIAEAIDFHYPPPASDETRKGFKIRTFGYEVTFEDDGKVNLRQEINYGEGNGVDDTTIQFSSLEEAGKAFVAGYMKVKEEIQRRRG